jgi:hypothetical protein
MPFLDLLQFLVWEYSPVPTQDTSPVFTMAHWRLCEGTHEMDTPALIAPTRSLSFSRS